jgi:hypothetical protein
MRPFWSAIVFVGLSSSAHAGFIEICKDSIPAGSLSGLFSFTIAGQSGTFDVPVGACTADFQLPDGLALITEVSRNDAMFFSVSTFPDDRLVSFDPIMGSATVQIVPGDISTETVVDFINAPIPEPGTGWLFGSGLTLWALRRNLMERPSCAAFRNATNSVVRRVLSVF